MATDINALPISNNDPNMSSQQMIQPQSQQQMQPQTQQRSTTYNPHIDIQPQPQSQQPQQRSTTYNPNIDVEQHAQNTPQNDVKITADDVNKIVNGVQQASQQNLTALPSRDIPRQYDKVTMDEQVSNPNYIPEPKGNNQDYIGDGSNYETLLKQQHIDSKNTKNNYENIDQFQTPVIIGILFFIFQLPFVKKLLKKYAKFVFLEDGNISTIGMLFKSLLFGLSYYFLMKGIEFI